MDRKAGAARLAGALTTAAGPPDTGQSRAGRHLLAQRPQDSQGLAAGSLSKRGDAGKATPPGPCLGAQRAVREGPCPSFTLDRCAGTAATMGQAKMSQGHPATGPLRQDGHSHRRDHGRLVGGGSGARIPGARPRKWETQGVHAVSCGAARSSPRTSLRQPAPEKEREPGPRQQALREAKETWLLPPENAVRVTV